MTTAKILAAARQTLAGRWPQSRCGACGRAFLARETSAACLAASCPSRRQRLYARSRPMDAETVWRSLRERFTAAGFAVAHRDDMINPIGETLFLSAALQVLDPVVHGGAPRPDRPLIVAQPVIRLNSTADVGAEEGFSTAFINVGSEEIVGSVHGYGRHLHAWLAAFRALGLDESRLALIAEPVRFRGGPHEGDYLIVDYGGVEIGEGIYIDTVRDRPSLRILDFGFGLERLLWAVNGTPAYYDNIGPLPLRISRRHELVDAARTAVLMAMSGVRPGHRSHGYRLRTTIGRLRAAAPGGAETGLPRLLQHAYDGWSAFLRPALPAADCAAVVTAELHRQANLELCRRLGIRPPPHDVVAIDPDSFCAALLRRGIPYPALLHTGPDQ